MIDPRISVVRHAVAEWHPVDERGAASKQMFMDFVFSATQPFSRDESNEHITGSAIVLSSSGVLLHQHKLGNIWCGPGGHVDGEELPCDAALRETLEETGVKAWHPDGRPRLAHVDRHETANGHIHHDLRYLLWSNPDDPQPGEGESPHVGWFEDEAAHEITDGSYSAALAQAGIGFARR